MRAAFSVLFITLSFIGYGQSISGKILDADGKTIEYATVRLFKDSDSTVASGAVTDSTGNFLVTEFESGDYYLKITFAGHEPMFYDLKPIGEDEDLTLDPIQLVLDKTLELEGVVAVGSLDVLKAGIDKKIYNTSEDISVRGGSVEDVLNNIPSIEVDQDGNISLRGDGNVTILIDGRPSALAMGNGQNLLDVIPANSIERIEVVTNPSARYDPDGTSGIINIVLKKNKVKGSSGLISATGATGNLYEANLAYAYRANKVNVFGNYSFNYRDGYRNRYSDIEKDITEDSVTNFIQEREGTDHRMGNTVVLGMDYYFNDRNTISFSGTGSLGDRIRTGDLESTLYTDDTTTVIDKWNRISEDPRQRKNMDANLNFKRVFNEDMGEWSINLNQSIGSSDIKGFYTQRYLDSNGESLPIADLEQRLANDEYRQITTAQSDFSYVFEKIRGRMEAGVKTIQSYESLNTVSETRDTLSGEYIEDTLANYEYSYTASVTSGYLIFGQERKKFKYQVGLRPEYATQEPNLISEGLEQHLYYFNIFPSAHIKYDFSDVSEASISYSRRINRPSSRELNPFTSYADPFNLHAGNPFLEPEYIDSYDLGYSFTKKKFIMTLSVFYRNTTNVINRVRVYYDNNVSKLTWGNIDRSESTGFEGVFIVKPVDWFKSTISINGNFQNYYDDSPGNDWNNSGVNWGAKAITSIDFWKKTSSFQINYRYTAPWVTPQGKVQRRPGLDLSLERRLMDKKLSLVFKVTDVFNRKGFTVWLDREGVSQYQEFKWLTRRFYLTVSYKFGNLDKKLKIPTEGEGGGGD